MAALRYLRDVFIVLCVLAAISGLFVGWAIFAACALAFTYAATFTMEYRTRGRK